MASLPVRDLSRKHGGGAAQVVRKGVILLAVQVNNVVGKALYDPGCAVFKSSYYFVKKTFPNTTKGIPLTFSLADGVTKIN